MPKSWLVRNAESAERARRQMHMSGLTPNGHPLWEPWEASPLVELAPAYGLIFPMLERRTRCAVYGKSQRLGVAPKASPPWSDNELIRIRKVYPSKAKEDVLASFPGRTWGAISKTANSRGIYRTPKPRKPTGNQLLDQILTRARSRNITMIELDAVTGAKRYFSNRLWKHGRFRHRAHALAVEFLGGHVEAEWVCQG